MTNPGEYLNCPRWKAGAKKCRSQPETRPTPTIQTRGTHTDGCCGS